LPVCVFIVLGSSEINAVVVPSKSVLTVVINSQMRTFYNLFNVGGWQDTLTDESSYKTARNKVAFWTAATKESLSKVDDPNAVGDILKKFGTDLPNPTLEQIKAWDSNTHITNIDYKKEFDDLKTFVERKMALSPDQKTKLVTRINTIAKLLGPAGLG